MRPDYYTGRRTIYKFRVHKLKSEFQIPAEFHYTKEHEWVHVEGADCRIGVTDYAQNSLHEIVYVDLPKVGAKVAQMQSLGTRSEERRVGKECRSRGSPYH